MSQPYGCRQELAARSTALGAGELGLAGAVLEEALARRSGCHRSRNDLDEHAPARRPEPSASGRLRPRSTARLASACASSGPRAHSAASASARACSASSGTTSSASPIRSASSALTWRPVMHQLLRPAGPDQAGQPLRAAAARDDAEQDLGLAEHGPLRRRSGSRRRAPARTRRRGRSRRPRR